MYKNIGTHYIHNGRILPSATFHQLKSDTIIYEVMRVIQGHILFLEDHIERLEHSLDRVGFKVDTEDIQKQLLTLVSVHPTLDKNIKLDIEQDNYQLYFIESHYPERELYQTGVATTAVKLERSNPTVKHLDMDYKKYIAQIKNNTFFEVLLINKNNKIIEGSSSNLLFLKNNTLYSAPLDTILTGITFKNVITLGKKLGLQVQYKSVDMGELDEMDGCFLTGTSLGVLPIQSIDHHLYDSAKQPVVLKLIQAYNALSGPADERETC